MSAISLSIIAGVENANELPLPVIVAQKWDFPLAHAETDGVSHYAILDWICGLVGVNATQAVNIYGQIKRKTFISNKGLPYTASDGKTYQRNYTDDKGLYLIAQHLRVTKARPVLDEIKKFLAAAGAFVDEVRLDPNAILTSGALNPDQAIDAVIQAFRNDGRDDNWIRARIEGKIKRHQFTAALTAAVADVLTRWHYATATDDIYKGLWERTAARLKDELGVPKGESLRDHQPMLALHYQGIAEEVSAKRLGESSELSWHDARAIIMAVAAFIGKQARETNEWLGLDLATGKPLLK